MTSHFWDWLMVGAWGTLGFIMPMAVFRIVLDSMLKSDER